MKERGETKKPTYFVKTWGCQMNFHDSERIAGILEKMGYRHRDSEREADIVILNTCSVREKSAAKVFTFLGKLKKWKDKKPERIIGFCGCVAQQEKDEIFRRFPFVDIVLGPRRTHLIGKSINDVLAKKERVRDTFLGDRNIFDLSGSPRRNTYPKAYVTIMEGCDRFCAYCIVPYTRGREVFKPPEEILKEIARSLEDGFKEIILLGQNVNAYRYGKSSFASLLETIIQRTPRLKRLRFVTSHPSFVTRELLSVMKHPSVCNHIHLPSQSGSDRILARMNRGYTRKEYTDLIGTYKETLKDGEVSTDIIVGFPGEGKEDFNETVSLLEEVEFNSIFSFKYSSRPYTNASKLEDTIPEETKMTRLEKVHEVQEKIQKEKHDKMIGRTVEILVDSVSRKRQDEVAGRTGENFIINILGSPDLIGKEIPVRITSAGTHSLRGEML